MTTHRIVWLLLPLVLAGCAPPSPQVVDLSCRPASPGARPPFERYPHPVSEVQPARARQWIAGHNASHDTYCGEQ